ncbi:tetraspanin-8-like [Pagrus major]|uniref:tetraspanin-8-like n=1 Tax=Pagrus major TaxID=143350 RepID=UPI003CC84D27
MGKVNVCLKRSYIIVTSLIAIMSALLLALTLFSHGKFHDDEEVENMLPGIRAMYIFSIGTLLVASIGLYGACKEKKWALIVFAVAMILSSLYLIVSEIGGLVVLPKMAEGVKMHYREMLPLANASEAFLKEFEELQTELQCCGMEQGYQDWGYNISIHCICHDESTNPCVLAPRMSSLNKYGPMMIYEEPCLPHLIGQVMIIINFALVVMAGIILLWVLSVALCIAILCRLNRKEDIPTVVYSPEAKAGNYTVLSDPAEYT